jgi:hypothetical protein
MFLAKGTQQALLYGTSDALPKPNLLRQIVLPRRSVAWDHGSTGKAARQ